jgi:pyrroline-5-carboxylate reductase
MSKLAGHRFAVIGAGNIGRILLERLTANGIPAADILICDSDPSRAEEASRRFGPHACSLTEEPLPRSEVILLTASPKATLGILKTFAPNLRQGQVVVSFAAAVPMSRLEAIVPSGVSVARVMPNAPSKVGRGMNPVVFGSSVTPEARQVIEAILQMLGETIEVNDDQMNWCIGLTGAAMRSLLPALEGMTLAGVEAGFAEADACRMAAQVLFGTASLVLRSELSIDEIKSLAPMEMLDEAALRQIFANAARAAKEKIDCLEQKLTNVF